MGNKPGKKMRIWKNFFVSKYLVAKKDVVPKKKNSLFRYPHPSIIFLLFAPYSDMWHVFSAVLTDLVLQF